MSVSGALGTMGNMREESGLEACRMQGDFSSGRSVSKQYADQVDNGLVSDDAFAKDGKGWGLVQFTWPGYKRGLLAFCRKHSVSIANDCAQIDYLVSILQTEFSALWSFLCVCGDDQLYTATDRFCREFERPAVNNVAVRFKAAKDLKNELQSQAADGINNSNANSTDYWPPRMICQGMFGEDVGVLQALLKARGYTLSDAAGIFGESTGGALRKYQADTGLAIDGVAGPKTWAAITKL